MKTVKAFRLAPCVLGVVVLLACSDRPTAPPSTPSFALAGPSANRGKSDRSTGATATLAWQKAARDLVAARSFAPVVATRLYALNSMAQYAAVVAVGRGPDDEDDERGGGRAADQARRGAIAGASVQLLSALQADAAPALEAQLAAYGADASGRTHPEFARGVAIGRTAATTMIDWAKNDGFSKVWDESMRNASGPGIWEGALAPKGSTTRPAPTGFQYPTITPYFLRALNGHTAQSQFRPLSPPEYLGARFNADLAEVRDISEHRTQTQIDIANLWNLAAGTVTTLGHWNEQAALFVDEYHLEDRAAAHLFALMNAAVMDATIGCWEAKFFYLMLRPTMADGKNISTVYPLPNHPSYPSGHSCLSSAAVTVLSRSFPAHADKLNADLIEAGMSRIYGGIHYRFDIEAGQALGKATAQWAITYDRRNGLLRAVGLQQHDDNEHERR